MSVFRFESRILLSHILLIAICCVILAPFASVAIADDDHSLHYTIDLSDAKNHYVSVQMNAIATDAETELMMAVWTPGSYLVREYARHLDSMEVVDGDGESLEFQKTRKNRWKVKTKPGQSFSVSYRLYCNEVSVRTNFVGHRYAVLNGAPTFMTIPDRMEQPHHVALSFPNGWQRSATSLRAGEEKNSYVAKDFDELVDSPIVAGLLDSYSFEVGDVTHQLVNVGEAGYWDGKSAAEDVAKIVEEQQKMWGDVPYDRYLFLNVIAEGRGGLEHDFSCLMLCSRWAFRDPEKYQDWLSLVSHEFFHTWNVRRLRPKPLMHYDYENEVYTDSLWIAEGITSYYEDVALIRAGLINRKDFLKRLSKNIEKVQAAHGRNVQSLRDASFDTWIKFYRPDENSANTRVSYYSKGAIVAFLLDAKIRELTANKKSLDDVMRLVWEKFSKTGYAQADFQQAANEVAGEDLSDWFSHTIETTKELEYDNALNWLGLQFAADSSEGDADKAKVEKGDSKPDSEKDKPKRWLGIKLKGETISSVTANSPATVAGINTGDRIVGINGFRIHDSLEKHLKQFKVGDQIELLISREGELLKFPIWIAEAPENRWTLNATKKPTPKQTANISAWIGEEESKTPEDK